MPDLSLYSILRVNFVKLTSHDHLPNLVIDKYVIILLTIDPIYTM